MSSWSATPIIDWLLRHGRHFTDPERLLGELCDKIVVAGFPISRVNVLIRLLHPQYFGIALQWEDGRTQSQPGRHPALQTDDYLRSPIRAIAQGERIVRRPLVGPDATLDYPLLTTLKERGFTDYVMVELTFSDGERNGVSLATRAAGGFSEADLAETQRLLHLFALLMEKHTQRQIATNLLRTYLGPTSGARVLEGAIQRGDGEYLDAVIWFSDLRNSTELAERLAQSAFLDMLNDYFDATAGAVLEHGGEVLRFIGDASLAVFPITGKDAGRRRAMCECALDAAGEAVRRVAECNSRRRSEGKEAIGYGIGLHVGQVLYGNIGTQERLEFSVIGSAANLTARVENLSKETGEPVVITGQLRADLSATQAATLRSLGTHVLRGVEDPVEVFGLREVV